MVWDLKATSVRNKTSKDGKHIVVIERRGNFDIVIYNEVPFGEEGGGIPVFNFFAAVKAKEHQAAIDISEDGNLVVFSNPSNQDEYDGSITTFQLVDGRFGITPSLTIQDRQYRYAYFGRRVHLSKRDGEDYLVIEASYRQSPNTIISLVYVLKGDEWLPVQLPQ